MHSIYHTLQVTIRGRPKTQVSNIFFVILQKLVRLTTESVERTDLFRELLRTAKMKRLGLSTEKEGELIPYNKPLHQRVEDRSTLWVTITEEEPSGNGDQDPQPLWDPDLRDSGLFQGIPAGVWPRLRVHIRSRGNQPVIVIDSMTQSTVRELKIALARTLHLDQEIAKRWSIWYNKVWTQDHMSLAFYRIQNGTLIDLKGKLLGGAGGGVDKTKTGKGTKTPKPVDDPVQAAFRALQLQQRRETAEQAAEAHKEAGTVMGEGEELRRQAAKTETEMWKRRRRT